MAAVALAPATSSGSVLRAARLSTKAPSSSAMNSIASSRERSGAMPASVKRPAAPVTQLSNTSAVAWRSGSLTLATSSATVAIGQASA